MSTSRPTTPAAISDTSSDPDSLSDVESGWTDLESRSGGRRSPISEPGDSDDARSAIDRFEGETWEGLTPEGGEHDVDEHDDGDNPDDESPLVIDPVPLPSVQPGPSEPSLEDWVSDAMGTSLLSEDDSLRMSTPHASVSSRSALRLSFPDPLSNSEHNILPSHILSRNHSDSTNGTTLELPDGGSAQAESLSPITPSPTGTNPEAYFSELEDDEEEDQSFKMPSVELAAPAVAYTLSVVLLGHPPLPHLKHVIVSTLIDMVAKALDGSPRILDGSDSARIYEVPFYTRQRKVDAESEGTCTHHVLVSDRTSGHSLESSFNAFDCPTLAIVFIQPPLSSPVIPSLPFNTRYIPLLLPSVSDGFASSLLDLSPSVLFDHSVPDISNSDGASRKTFALQQCQEMQILRSRLDETEEVLTVEEFAELPGTRLSVALKDMVFPSKEAPEVDAGQITAGLSGVTVFRKQLVFISAFFIAMLLGSTVLLRNASQSSSPTATMWSFLQPYMNRTSATLPSVSRTPPAAPELPQSPHPLAPASLKSLAVSVFRPEITENKAASTSKDSRPRSEKGAGNRHLVDSRHEVRPASIEPAARALTLDAPSPKSLSLVSQPQFSKGKGKEKAVDAADDAQLPFPSSTTSLSARITNALSPFFDAVNHDIREIQEAIDALLHALWQLREQASQGLGEVVQVLSEQAGRKAQGFADKVQRGAQTVGERVSKRHARAKYNARKVRDVGDRYISAARQKLGRGVERARGNAKVLKESLGMTRKKSRWGREEGRKLKRHAREERKSAKKEARAKSAEGKRRASGEIIFHSVMALVVPR